MPEGNTQKKITDKILIYLQEREDTMRTYIQLMELVRGDISSRNTDNLEEHGRVEEHIVSRLESLQKTIVSLRADYPADDPRYTGMEDRFRTMCGEAVRMNQENQALMRGEMVHIHKDIDRLRRLRAKTGKHQSQPDSRYIDIET